MGKEVAVLTDSAASIPELVLKEWKAMLRWLNPLWGNSSCPGGP